MRAIIFDFGGVVVHFLSIGMQEFIANALQVPLEQVYLTFFAQGAELIRGIISEKIFWQKYASSIQRSLPIDWFERITFFLANNICLDQGVLKIVQALQAKNFIIPLLSNISSWQVCLFKKLGYFNYFNPL